MPEIGHDPQVVEQKQRDEGPIHESVVPVGKCRELSSAQVPQKKGKGNNEKGCIKRPDIKNEKLHEGEEAPVLDNGQPVPGNRKRDRSELHDRHRRLDKGIEKLPRGNDGVRY